MADREKVIYSIERCICHVPGACQDCAYYAEPNDKCTETMLNDAISLLKAQEPSVMPADEIVLSAEPSKWLWVERKGDYCAEAYKAGKTVSGLISFDSETPGAFLYCERPDEYGKTWRCWTSRPSDSERENTPWE